MAEPKANRKLNQYWIKISTVNCVEYIPKQILFIQIDWHAFDVPLQHYFVAYNEFRIDWVLVERFFISFWARCEYPPNGTVSACNAIFEWQGWKILLFSIITPLNGPTKKARMNVMPRTICIYRLRPHSGKWHVWNWMNGMHKESHFWL